MSGGSFDYLYCLDAEELLDPYQGNMLEYMIKALGELGYADDAARESRELLATIRESQAIIKREQDKVQVGINRLKDVWHAMEWYASCDYGEDTFKEVLEKWRKAKEG